MRAGWTDGWILKEGERPSATLLVHVNLETILPLVIRGWVLVLFLCPLLLPFAANFYVFSLLLTCFPTSYFLFVSLFLRNGF